jgi:GTP cyclohydrolase IB
MRAVISPSPPQVKSDLPETFCKTEVRGYLFHMFKPGENGSTRMRRRAVRVAGQLRHGGAPRGNGSPRRAPKTHAILHDKQSEPDHRELRINKVGVRDLRFPIQVRDKAHAVQNTVATIGMFVDLPKEFKGTHMSRFLEVLNAHGNVIHVENIQDILYAMQARFHAATSHLEIEFPYFMVKRAPVTGKESLMDYVARFDAAACHKDIFFLLTVKAKVTTLCPCSKAIAAYGAHNQRGEVTVQIRSRKAVWIEDLIAIIEGSASSELFALLKRQDEKAVTERAYDNPVFVEDLVRNVALKLNAHPDVTWYKVEAENHESIHNHNAYACIEKS